MIHERLRQNENTLVQLVEGEREPKPADWQKSLLSLELAAVLSIPASQQSEPCDTGSLVPILRVTLRLAGEGSAPDSRRAERLA